VLLLILSQLRSCVADIFSNAGLIVSPADARQCFELFDVHGSRSKCFQCVIVMLDAIFQANGATVDALGHGEDVSRVRELI